MDFNQFITENIFVIAGVGTSVIGTWTLIKYKITDMEKDIEKLDNKIDNNQETQRKSELAISRVETKIDTVLQLLEERKR